MNKMEQIMFDTLNKIATLDLDIISEDIKGFFAKEEAKTIYLRVLAKDCLKKIKEEEESI